MTGREPAKKSPRNRRLTAWQKVFLVGGGCSLVTCVLVVGMLKRGNPTVDPFPVGSDTAFIIAPQPPEEVEPRLFPGVPTADQEGAFLQQTDGLSPSDSPKPPTSQPKTEFFDPNELSLGVTGFTLPLEMAHDAVETVELIVSRDRIPTRIESHSHSHVETLQIQVSPTMTAKLVGNGFDIEPITPLTQVVARTGETTWSWTIHPKAKVYDKQPLVLSLSADLDGTYAGGHYAVRTLTRSVNVTIGPLDFALDFAGDHWAWCGVGPASMGLIGWWGKRVFAANKPQSSFKRKRPWGRGSTNG